MGIYSKNGNGEGFLLPEKSFPDGLSVLALRLKYSCYNHEVFYTEMGVIILTTNDLGAMAFCNQGNFVSERLSARALKVS